jgi:hypothetical protein
MSNDENQQWQMSNKAPALLIGLLLILGGFLLVKGRWRYSVPIGLALIAGGFGAVIYSTTIHEWCAPVGAARFGKEWGSGFWHGPNAWDCYHLVMGHKR